MYPQLFPNVVVRDTDRIVPYTLCLQEHADYFIPHRHHYVEFSYVIRGEGTETVDGKVHPLLPGTFSLLLPSQIHTLHAGADTPVTFYVGGIGLDLLSGMDPLLGGLEDRLLRVSETLPSFVRYQDADAGRMEEHFRIMLRCLAEPDPWSSPLFLAHLIEVFAEFDKRRRIDTPFHHPAPTRTDQRAIVHYVQAHANEPLTLRHLSERFHRSESAISAGFKRLMGSTYLDFLHELRIRDACALLRSTSLSVTEVALEVGFESYETFSRAFRKRMGTGAQKWRKTVQ